MPDATFAVRASGHARNVKVWIDQDLCTGDGICVDHCPEVFTLLDDGIAYVLDGDRVLNDPGGADCAAPVPVDREQATIDAAVACPGECIFIEADEPAELSSAA